MAKKPAIRNYNFEDATLITESGRIKTAVERDSKDFAKRNVTAATLDDFQIKIDAFDDFPTDEELEGVVMNATAAKNGIAENIRQQARVIRNMADEQYHGGGSYKTFGFDGMDKMNDANLYRLAKRVVRVGTKLMPDMQNQGLTTDMLTTLQQSAIEFDAAIDDQDEKIEDRDIQTQTRINLGNAVYEKLVSLASVGKSLYQDSDEAKYNDYVLYNETGDTKATPEGEQ